ncbi:MAG: ABC transporter permease [Oceanospirillaceae bacterium]
MSFLSEISNNLSLLAFSPPGWGGALLKGLLSSLQIALGGYSLGLLIGIAGACTKLYASPLSRDLMACYTTAVRAIPELVLILLLYYAGSDLINQLLVFLSYPMIEINGLTAGIIVIGIVQGAYSTEVIRGAISTVPIGQIEAAFAFGMSPFQVFRRITMPAMLVHAIPGLSNLWLIATKDTALLAVVGFSELTLITKQAAGGTKQHMLFYCAAAVLYLLVTLISNWIISRIDHRVRRGYLKGV